MAEPLDPALGRIRALVLDDACLVRAVAAGRRRGGQTRWRRVELRYVDLKAGRRLQVTSYDQTQAHVTNHADPDGALDELLAEPFANWHVETTTEVHQLRVTKKGAAVVHVQRRSTQAIPDRSHDAARERLLPADSAVLRELGIADSRGRIKPSRQAKYRQVEEFLRDLRATLDDAQRAGALRIPTPEDPLRVVDLGCGNAYLTFAAHAWLADRMPVRLVGVDVKEQSRRHNTEVAGSLGVADEVSFMVAAIGAAELEQRPDVVLALHACDTATDDALARAVRWQTPVVLAAPCCHHDIANQLRSALPPSGYEPVIRDGILRERFAETLTDALRAEVLRRHGYRVEVVEFVESRHTPRNSLIRAVRTGHQAAGSDGDRLVHDWQLRPRLALLLDADG